MIIFTTKKNDNPINIYYNIKYKLLLIKTKNIYYNFIIILKKS